MPLSNALPPDIQEIPVDNAAVYDPNAISEIPSDAATVQDLSAIQEVDDDGLDEDFVEKEYMQPADVPPPSPKEAKFVKYNKDGSALFSNGVSLLKDGSIAWTDEETGVKFAQKNPYVKAVKVGKVRSAAAPKPKLYHNPVDGRTYDMTDMASPKEIQFPEGQAKLTPSAKLSALREERKSYTDNQATIAMYGKGQMPGMHQIKGRLDAILDSAGGDYSKLTPQQLATFVFQFSKFNDPNSAVLLGEYNAAASRLGLGDRAKLALEKAMKGDPITDKQAEDIYKTINVAHSAFKEEHFRDLQEREAMLKEAGMDVRKLGVPPSVMQEYQTWKAQNEEGMAGKQPSATTAPNKTSQAIAEAEKWLAENPNSPKAQGVFNMLTKLKGAAAMEEAAAAGPQ